MLSCQALLDVSALGLRTLAPGSGGALGRPLLWVHNTELLDPAEYVRERELVLTNGLWHDGGNGARFVANVVRAGAAGIVFGLRAETPATPPDLVDACRRADLPLLELPIEVPFTAVTRAAAAELAEQRQATLVGQVRRGAALADAISGGSGAVGVLEVLRRDHALPLAVVDRSAGVLAAAGAELTDGSAAAIAEALLGHPPPLELDLAAQGTAALFIVIGTHRADAALACLRPLAELTADEHDALTQAAHYLSLEVVRIQLAQSVEARFAGELLEMIHSGPRSPAEVHSRLEAFGVAADRPMMVVALARVAGGAAADAELAASVGAFFPQRGVPAAVAAGTHDVVAIFSSYGASGTEPSLVHALLDHVRAAEPHAGLVAGIGGPATGSARLRGPLVEAREACRVLRGRPSGPPVARFGDLGVHRLLLASVDTEAVRRASEGTLTPIRGYDRRHGGGLETTARVYLEHDGRLTAAADALFIHVNTLRNRLAKIAELTGCDVMTTEGRVDLFLAIHADAMLHREGR